MKIKISSFSNRKLIEVFRGEGRPARIYLDNEQDFKYIERFKRACQGVSYKRQIKLFQIKSFSKLTYYLEVWLYTEQFEKILNKKQTGEVIDHIVPITYGYKNNIKTFYIGNVDNLQVISEKENLLKGSQLGVRGKELIKAWGMY